MYNSWTTEHCGLNDAQRRNKSIKNNLNVYYKVMKCALMYRGREDICEIIVVLLADIHNQFHEIKKKKKLNAATYWGCAIFSIVFFLFIPPV